MTPNKVCGMRIFMGCVATACVAGGTAFYVLHTSTPHLYPAGYPSDYGATVAAAQSERTLVVYSTVDAEQAKPLVDDFRQLYPGIEVDYHDLNSGDLNARFLDELAQHRPSADAVWSSAMDQQMKLVNDNFAQRYESPEAASLPKWAVWRAAGFATTFEPVVFLYNKHFVAESDVPRTHADFARLLTTPAATYRGRVVTYDVERSALGLLFASLDSRMQAGFREFAKALGDNRVDLETSTAAMLKRVSSGRAYLGYNAIGSYALAHGRSDPSIGIVVPEDYALVMSRIVFLSREAPHPNAGRLWIDYLLSRRGQGVLSSQAEMSSIRDDVPGAFTAEDLRKTLGARARPIGFNPSLLVSMDRAKRDEFLRRWREDTATLSPPIP